jgi:hypothetical protein
MRVAELLLRGAGGEPVDFARTIVSHGVLLPGNVDERRGTYTTTLALPRTRPRTIRISVVRDSPESRARDEGSASGRQMT